MFSIHQDSRLRLQHRQIAASIIEKTFAYHSNCLNEYLSFPKYLPSYLLHFHIKEKPDEEFFTIEFGINDMQIITKQKNLKFSQLNYKDLMLNTEYVLGKDDKLKNIPQESMELL